MKRQELEKLKLELFKNNHYNTHRDLKELMNNKKKAGGVNKYIAFSTYARKQKKEEEKEEEILVKEDQIYAVRRALNTCIRVCV